MLKVKKKNDGFTLIEMAVVITILAILTVALVPSIKKHVDSAKKVAVESQCREIVVAVETYNAEVNQDDEIIAESKPILLVSLDGVSTKPKVITFEEVLQIVRIQELLGDNTNENTPRGKDKEPSSKLKNKFDKIPKTTPYDLIKSVAEGSSFTIDKKGSLCKVYEEESKSMKDVTDKN